MEYEFEIKFKVGNSVWKESINVPDGEDPETYIRKVISEFNEEEQRRHSDNPDYPVREREFVSLLGSTQRIFCDIFKMNTVTITRGIHSYDLMCCKRCHLQRQRFGLGEGFSGEFECVPERTCLECMKVFKTEALYKNHKEKGKHKTPHWVADGV